MKKLTVQELKNFKLNLAKSNKFVTSSLKQLDNGHIEVMMYTSIGMPTITITGIDKVLLNEVHNYGYDQVVFIYDHIEVL